MSLFRVTRATEDIGTGVHDQALASSVASLSTSLERLVNNRRHTGGDTTQTDNESLAEISGTMLLTSVSNSRFTRSTFIPIGSGAARFSWEILEYLGSPTGPDAFIVRSRNVVTLSASTPTVATSLDTTATDANRCIPFICSIIGDDDTTASANNGTAVAYLISASSVIVERGGAAGNMQVVVVVVEFTGSNWIVGHAQSGVVSLDSGTMTIREGATGAGAVVDVGDWSTAYIHHQMRGDGADNTNQAIADTSCIVEPGSLTTTIDYEFYAANHDAISNRIVCHVLGHPELSVTRYSSTDSSEGAVNIDITSAGLSDLSLAFCEISHYSSGTGVAYGRGWKNARLTSTTNLETWVHRSGNTVETRLQVIDLEPIGKAFVTFGATAGSPTASFSYDAEFLAAIGATVGSPTADFVANVNHVATFSATVGSPTASFTADASFLVVFGATVGSPVAVIAAEATFLATIGATAGSPAAAFVAEIPGLTATFSATAGSPTAAFVADVEFLAIIGASVGSPTAAVVADATFIAIFGATVGSPTAAFVANIANRATISATTGPPTATGWVVEIGYRVTIFATAGSPQAAFAVLVPTVAVIATRTCLAGSFVYSSTLTGTYVVATTMAGSYDLEEALAGVFATDSALTGSYDISTALTGELETC